MMTNFASPRRFGRLAAAVAIASLTLSCSNSMSPSSGGLSYNVLIVQGAATMAGAAFSPSTFTTKLSTGGKVTWENGDFTSSGYSGGTGVTHHLVSDAPLFDTGNIAPLSTASFTFTTAGTYTYHCMIHPTMVGTIVVNP
jgi:plastocyanin